jgi:hypothetical protein
MLVLLYQAILCLHISMLGITYIAEKLQITVHMLRRRNFH